MSATDELRRLLDERGVEWEAWNDCITVVPPSTHYLEVNNGALCMAVVGVTPEQAIAAWNTRAERTCHNDHGHCDKCGSLLVLKGNYCFNCGSKVIEQ